MRGRRSVPAAHTIALLAIASLVGACEPAAGPRLPQAPASPYAPTGAMAAPGACNLAPTGALVQRTLVAPGPSSATMARTFQLYVPRGVAAGSSVPLLISLHGLGANGPVQNAVTHWSSFDDQLATAGSPFILALPEGVQTLWFWGLGSSYDVRFVFDVIAQIRSSRCVDAAQIYVDGWSEGAYMAQRMACANEARAVDSKGIALAAVHGYAGGDPGVIAQSCRPGPSSAPAPSILLSQGLDDTLVNAQQTGFSAFQAWGMRYACRPPSGSFTAAQQLADCRRSTAVAWWPIDGFGHFTWSCAADLYWHNRGVWSFLTKGVAPTTTTCS